MQQCAAYPGQRISPGLHLPGQFFKREGKRCLGGDPGGQFFTDIRKGAERFRAAGGKVQEPCGKRGRKIVRPDKGRILRKRLRKKRRGFL